LVVDTKGTQSMTQSMTSATSGPNIHYSAIVAVFGP
jgi:hypothetical protein